MTSSIFLAFSPKVELAKAVRKAMTKAATPKSQEQKDRKKQLDRERTDRLRAENLAQRALIEGRRR
ncbi:hypothetical protein CKY39_16160 [Variovorax boronicumulans]|uniref:Uncharacterized protein n=1 Tax=Variovorax boronicumulans TaxID=436515 RepID=A0A250DJZ0_9BURK|nr:hypothetical protein [Variovorax boronicumulans]ATA54572.1 hypothetical protein CKY39_16160 [Variovorax boronicumulans]